MATCTSCFNRSCPAPVNVEIHQTFLQLDGVSAVVDVHAETVVGTQVALPFAPLAGYPVKVLVNGLLQQARIAASQGIIQGTRQAQHGDAPAQQDGRNGLAQAPAVSGDDGFGGGWRAHLVQ